MGKSSKNGPFPMAMLNNQRVYTFRFLDTPSIYKNAVYTNYLGMSYGYLENPSIGMYIYMMFSGPRRTLNNGDVDIFCYFGYVCLFDEVEAE